MPEGIPSCRSLLALLACFMGRLITNGSIFCMGVYYESIRAYFGTDHFETALLFSLSAGTLQGAGLIVSSLLKFFSERQVVMVGGVTAALAIFIGRFSTEYYQFLLSVGFANGFGQGLVYVTVPVAGSYIFKEHLHHVAMSLQNIGDGVGFFLFPVIYESLIKVFSWRNSLLIVSGIVLNLTAFGALLKTPEMSRHKATMIEKARRSRSSEKRNSQVLFSTESQISRSSALCHLWTDPLFILLLICALCHAIGFNLFITFVFSHMTSLNISEESAAWVMTSFGISSIFSRLFTSFLKNHMYLRRWSVFALAHLIEGLSMIGFALIDSANHIWAHVTVMCIVGFSSGFIGALVCCVMLDVLGPEKLEDSFSFMMAFWGLGSFAGAPLGGILRDFSSSYKYPLAVGGFINAAGCLPLIPFFCITKYYETPKTIDEESFMHQEEQLKETDNQKLHLKGHDPVKGSLIELYGGPEIEL